MSTCAHCCRDGLAAVVAVSLASRLPCAGRPCRHCRSAEGIRLGCARQPPHTPPASWVRRRAGCRCYTASCRGGAARAQPRQRHQRQDRDRSAAVMTGENMAADSRTTRPPAPIHPSGAAPPSPPHHRAAEASPGVAHAGFSTTLPLVEDGIRPTGFAAKDGRPGQERLGPRVVGAGQSWLFQGARDHPGERSRPSQIRTTSARSVSWC